MARTVRLLVVDPDGAARQALADLMRREPRLELAGSAASAEEATRHASHSPVDAILIAVDLVADPESLAGFGDTPVVAIGREAQPEVMRRAMTAGARDFLVWPFTAHALLQALEDIGLLAVRDAETSPVAVVSARGGSGKSIVALNLAILRARRDEREVALLDLDLDAGSLALYAGVKAQATVGDLLRLGAAIDSDALRNVAVKLPGVPVHLFASPAEPGSWSSTPAEALRGWVDRVESTFPCTIVDLPAAFDERTLAVLDACARAVFVTPAELPALYHAARWMRRIADEIGWPRERFIVVCNRTHPEMKLPPKAVVEALATPNVVQVPFDSTAASSVQSGQALAGRRNPVPFVRALEPLLQALAAERDRRGPAQARASVPRSADVPNGLGPAMPW